MPDGHFGDGRRIRIGATRQDCESDAQQEYASRQQLGCDLSDRACEDRRVVITVVDGHDEYELVAVPDR